MDGRKSYRFTAALGRGARDRRRRRRGDRDERRAADARRRSAPRSPRFIGDDRAGAAGLFRRSRSTGSGPMIWPARARRSSWRRARSRIDALRALVAMPDADHAVFEVDCGKGTYIRGLGARPGARAWARVGHVVGAAPHRGRAVHRSAGDFAGQPRRPSGIVPPPSGTCFRSRPRWTTSRRWP